MGITSFVFAFILLSVAHAQTSNGPFSKIQTIPGAPSPTIGDDSSDDWDLAATYFANVGEASIGQETPCKAYLEYQCSSQDMFVLVKCTGVYLDKDSLYSTKNFLKYGSNQNNTALPADFSPVYIYDDEVEEYTGWEASVTMEYSFSGFMLFSTKTTAGQYSMVAAEEFIVPESTDCVDCSSYADVQFYSEGPENYASFYSEYWMECKTECNDDSECKQWMHAPNQMCYMYNNVHPGKEPVPTSAGYFAGQCPIPSSPSPSATVSISTSTSGTPVASPSPTRSLTASQSPAACHNQYGKKFSKISGFLRSVTVASDKSCMIICQMDEDCQKYQFGLHDFTCILMDVPFDIFGNLEAGYVVYPLVTDMDYVSGYCMYSMDSIPSMSSTATISVTSSMTPSDSPTVTPLASRTPDRSLSPSTTSSPDPSFTMTSSRSPTISITASSSRTARESITRAPSGTATSSVTAEPSTTSSISVSPSTSLSGSPSSTPFPSVTPARSISATTTNTPVPSETSAPSRTASKSVSAEPSVTRGASPTRSISPSMAPSVTSSSSTTPSVTVTASTSNTPLPSTTPARSLTRDPSVTASTSATPESSSTPVASPTRTSSRSAAPSVTREPSTTSSTTATRTASKTPVPSVSSTISESATLSHTPYPSRTAAPSKSHSSSISTTNTASGSISVTPAPSPSNSMTPKPSPFSLVNTDVCEALDCGDEVPNVLVFGDYSATGGGQVGGQLFVQGDADLRSYTVGNELGDSYGSRDDLVVGGALNYASGQVRYGNIVFAADSSHVASTVFNSLGEGSVISQVQWRYDFNRASQCYTNRQAKYCANDATGSFSMQGQNAFFDGTGKGGSAEIFNLTCSELKAIKDVTFQNMNGAAALVNIHGDDCQIGLTTTYPASKIVYNFCEATNILVHQSVMGSILAPAAEVSFHGQVEGQMIMGNGHGGGQQNSATFTGCLPNPQPDNFF